MSETHRDSWLMYGEVVTALEGWALAEYLRQCGFEAESGGWYVDAVDENGARIAFVRARPQLHRVTGTAPTVTRMEECATRLAEALECAGIRYVLEVHASADEMTTYAHPEWSDPEE